MNSSLQKKHRFHAIFHNQT